MDLPAWLPSLFDVSNWTHNTYDLLYKIFHSDFFISKTNHYETPVRVSRKKEDGKELTFWHITTRTNESSERLPDHRRCERLPWLKPMLEQSSHPDVLAWESTEGDGTLKTYVWLKDHDYIAIMKTTKKGHLMLITAYWVEYENTKRKLLKKYNTRNEKANA